MMGFFGIVRRGDRNHDGNVARRAGAADRAGRPRHDERRRRRRHFVAGIGAMGYARFTLFNLIGAVSWVGLLTLAGYFFGNLPWVQKNLSVVIVGIIAISMIPVLVGWWQHRKEG